MKHASSSTLDSLEGLLVNVRALPGLSERKRGIFYIKSKAYLHFHEDPAGIFADIKLAEDEFVRFRVSTKQEQTSFLKVVIKNRSE